MELAGNHIVKTSIVAVTKLQSSYTPTQEGPGKIYWYFNVVLFGGGMIYVASATVDYFSNPENEKQAEWIKVQNEVFGWHSLCAAAVSENELN